MGRGQWRAEGTKRAGTIFITERDGSRRTLRYRVHAERGTPYWNEYKFNAVHYAR